MAENTKAKVLTILFLGKTGVGKSTFINAFANYLLHEEMEQAIKNLTCLIPLKFSATDENHKTKIVSFGDFKKDDGNENVKPGESSTQKCRCYVFELGNFKINIIDTPGIADCRGVDTDGVNMRNLLSFISNYKEINAICLLLTPNDCRADAIFKYSLMQLLVHLNKSASQNIVFVYTNSRATHYRPGETGATLKTLLEVLKNRPPNVDIKYDMENTFCFDNESFRFLVSDANGIKFPEDEVDDYIKSWNRSRKECKRMLAYINKIKPHQVQDTVSINRARQTILSLTQPLGDTAKMIGDNMKECERHQKTIRECEDDIYKLSRNMYTPTVDLQSEKLDKPMTVCGDPSCCKQTNVKGNSVFEYTRICHDPCHCTIPNGDIIGNIGLLDCRAFNKYTPTEEYQWKKLTEVKSWHPDNDLTNTNENGEIWCASSKREKSENCFNCGHSFKLHLNLITKTTVVHKEKRDDDKYWEKMSKEEVKRAKEDKIRQLQARNNQLKSEQKIISECTGKFAHFLKTNAMTPINDAYEEYLKHLIKVEEDFWKDTSDRTVESLNQMLKNHRVEKKFLEDALNQSGGQRQADKITKEDVDNLLNKLFNLEISGPIIKKYLQDIERSQQSVHSVYNEIKFNETVSGSNMSGNKLKNWLNI